MKTTKWLFRLNSILSRLAHGRPHSRVLAREELMEMAEKADLWDREMRLRRARDKRKKQK